MKTFQITFKDPDLKPVTLHAEFAQLNEPFWCFYTQPNVGGLVAAYNVSDIRHIRTDPPTNDISQPTFGQQETGTSDKL